MASRRSLRGELHDAPGDCCLQLLDPLDVPGDSFRTAKSHSISTASCLLKSHNLLYKIKNNKRHILSENNHASKQLKYKIQASFIIFL